MIASGPIGSRKNPSSGKDPPKTASYLTGGRALVTRLFGETYLLIKKTTSVNVEDPNGNWKPDDSFVPAVRRFVRA